MGNIVILDELTSNQIAAGEVVERPASVVKELIENSIDAKATSINIEIRNGGIAFIRVTDNGCGIETDDIQMAFERHATSKIRGPKDLEAISSFGFRGEALASIASVSKIKLLTKTDECENGILLELSAGKVIDLSPYAAKVGTSITVSELFFNTPARFKFLKKDSTEAGHISDAISRIALGNPNISFKFINNKNLSMHTPGNNDLKSTIFSIYGKEIAKNILPVLYESNDVTVSGFVGKPEIARATRNHQTFFINKRYIKSKLITAAIDSAYKTLLMKNKYPFAILNLEINPALIDINVHPAKLEVKFSKEQEIFKVLYSGINNALSKADYSRPQEREKTNRDFFALNRTKENTVSNFSSGISKEDVVTSGKKDETVQPKNNAYATENFQVDNQVPRLDSFVTKKQVDKKADTIEKEDEKPYEAKDLEKAQINSLEDSALIKGNEGKQENLDDLKKADKSNEEDEKNEVNKGDEEYIESFIEETKESEGLKENQNANVSVSKSTNASTNTNTNESANASTNVNINTNASINPEQDMHYAIEKEKKAKDGFIYAQRSITEKTNWKIFSPNYTYIGQIFKTYIVVEQEKETILIDQHAAHERIMFERLKEKYYNSESLEQMLIEPLSIELTANEVLFLKDKFDIFKSVGFVMDEFGQNSFLIRSVPFELKENTDLKKVFLEILDFLMNNYKEKNAKEVIEQALYNMACKSAIKANKSLCELEVRTLINDLEKLENPYTCPHGRPTVLMLKKHELEKLFKRIV